MTKQVWSGECHPALQASWDYAMHEMGIANSVLDVVRNEMKRYPDQRVSKVGLFIGEFVAVDPESLRFCFEAIVKSSDLAPLALEIEWCPAGPGRRGDELEIAYLELDEAGVLV